MNSTDSDNTDMQTTGDMTAQHKDMAANWFARLRDQICATFESIEAEREHPAPADRPVRQFARKNWQRDGGGGGEISVMHGDAVSYTHLTLPTKA